MFFSLISLLKWHRQKLGVFHIIIYKVLQLEKIIDLFFVISVFYLRDFKKYVLMFIIENNTKTGFFFNLLVIYFLTFLHENKYIFSFLSSFFLTWFTF